MLDSSARLIAPSRIYERAIVMNLEYGLEAKIPQNNCRYNDIS